VIVDAGVSIGEFDSDGDFTRLAGMGKVVVGKHHSRLVEVRVERENGFGFTRTGKTSEWAAGV
jgi:hypothetical protein